MARPGSLTFLQKIDIPIGIIQALLGTLLTAITAPFRGQNTPSTFKRHILLSVTRKVLARLTPVQLQSIAGSTESNYLAWTKAQQFTPQIVDLPNIDTKAFWIGEPEAKHVVLYYHGGGYNMPGSDGHFTFVSSLVSQAARSGKSIAALVLQYDLAPGAHYPRQLIQAVELLRHAITTLRKSPDNIMLMGDSAGGNLILGILSHAIHPHPSIKPLELSKPLRAAMMSSPVTVLNTHNERFQTHEAQDPASAETIRVWLSNLLGDKKPDAWNEPLGNDAQWWTNLGSDVEEALITVAAKEMFADDTIALVDKIKTVTKVLTLFKSEVDFHAEPTIGPSLGLQEGEAARFIISWAIERS